MLTKDQFYCVVLSYTLQYLYSFIYYLANPPLLVSWPCVFFFFFKDPIYLQSVTIHSANGGKGEGWHVEEYLVALLC
jgi:hypothetical protein